MNWDADFVDIVSVICGACRKGSVMRTVGQRKERPIPFSASSELLVEGARFNDELHGLPTGDKTFIPKGVFRFKSHEDANRHQQECLVAGMAQIALELTCTK